MIAETQPPGATRTTGGCVAFRVPYVPVAKGRPRVALRNGRAHAYTPSRTVISEWQIRQEALAARGDLPPFEGPLALSIEVRLAMPKRVPKKRRDTAMPTSRPDIDNYVKLAMDACSPLWVDDAQIVTLTVVKIYDSQPGWSISVSTIP